MSAMDWLSIFPAFRSSIQAGKNAHDNGANFWQSLGAGLSELFTGSYQEEKELQSTIDAEQRAMENTRQLRDEENAYNTPQAQAERFKQAGINPLSAMTGGAQAASNTVVTSSGGQQSRTDGSLSALLPFMQAMADIDVKEKQANLLEEQSSSQRETGFAQFMANCFTRLQSGDKGDYVGKQTVNFDPKYKLTLSDDGTWKVSTLSKEEQQRMKAREDGAFDIEEISTSVYVFDSDSYGKFTIHENSHAVKLLNEQLTKAIGDNLKTAQSLSDSIFNAFVSAVDLSHSGRELDIKEFEKNCKAIATLWQYGTKGDAKLVGLEEDSFTPSNWKFWCKLILEDAELNFGTLVDMLPNVLKKFKSSFTETYDADGALKGVSRTETIQ